MKNALAVLLAGCSFSSQLGAKPDGGTDATDGSNGEEVGQAWLDGWAKRKPIVIHEAAIPGTAPLVDFPVMVVATGITAQPDGRDIVFTDADGMTRLASEIESVGGGTVVAWVRVPSLPAIADATLYMYYGNPNGMQGDAKQVWSAGFLGVWHLGQDPGPAGTGDIKDVLGAHSGTADGSMSANDSVDAQIGRGLRFDGSVEYIDFPTALDVGNQFTLSIWFKLANGSAGIRTLFTNSRSGLDKDGFRLFVNSDTTNDRKVRLETSNGAQNATAATDVNAVTVNAWTHVAAVVDRTAGTALLYVDGMNLAVASTIRTDFMTSSDFEIARMEDIYLFPGDLDELEIASGLRSPQWIQATVANQKTIGQFETVMPEEIR